MSESTHTYHVCGPEYRVSGGVFNYRKYMTLHLAQRYFN